MKYVVSVSGGAGSILAAHRTVEMYGSENVVLLFADTNSEHESLYEGLEYMRDVMLPNCEFVWLNKGGRNIWDVFDETGMIRTARGGCKASLILKQEALDSWVQNHFSPDECVRVTGLDWSEEDRIERTNLRLSPYKVIYPMTEPPRLNPCQQVELVEQMGYPKQWMYHNGYPHNNCAGGCTLAGISQWVGLHKDAPDVFYRNAEREKEFQDKRNSDFTVLRNRRGGGPTKGMTLYELADRIKAGDVSHLREFRSTCGCMTPENATCEQCGKWFVPTTEENLCNLCRPSCDTI